jgi:drug/metabolite transporter (DMT)-like permease
MLDVDNEQNDDDKPIVCTSNNRQRSETIDSICLSSCEAMTIVDPIVQSYGNSCDTSSYSIQRSSILFTPLTTMDENCLVHSIEQPSIRLNTCLSYLQRFTGIFYSLLASLLFTSSNFIIQQLDVVLLDVFLVRFIFQGVISFGFIVHKGYRPYSYSSNGLIFIRSLIAALGSICFYLSLAVLPLPDLTTLRYTQVIWTALLTWLIFRERINYPTIVASLFTLFGVVCVAQPSFLFTRSTHINGTLLSTVPSTDSSHVFGMCIALVCALSISTAIVLNKKLLENNVQQSIIMFHFIVTTFALLVIIQTYYWICIDRNYQRFNIQTIYLRKEFLYATCLATLQLIPMILTQKSLKREHPSIVTVVQASDILFAIIFQNVFSTIKSNRLALIGSALVLTSIIIVGSHKLWLDRKQHTNRSTKG